MKNPSIWLDCKEKRLSQKVAKLEKCFASFPVGGSAEKLRNWRFGKGSLFQGAGKDFPL